MSDWTDDQLRALGAARELEVAARGEDDGLTRWTPVWVVVAGRGVYVRTWRLRDTGWYGRARRSGRARIRVPGLETEVDVTQVGDGAGDVTPGGVTAPALGEAVDAAYRAKYGGGSASMVTAEPVASTLRLRVRD